MENLREISRVTIQHMLAEREGGQAEFFCYQKQYASYLILEFLFC
jgi:hypothetical protein